jgi:hypothetical protein
LAKKVQLKSKSNMKKGWFDSVKNKAKAAANFLGGSGSAKKNVA